MKNLKKLFAVVIVVAMMVSVMAPAFAAGAFGYEAEAQVLNDLGLYKGISETEFVPDLGTALNRETGVVMLLRIFGLEADADAIADADAVLAKFKDAASIASWAKKAVAYAVENGLVQGLPDGTFGPKAALNGKAYCTLILRQLGYTPDYNNAPAELADKGGLTVLEAVKFTSKELIKDDLVGISYGALKAEYSDGATVIEKLIEANPDMEEVATTAGLVEEVTITSLASVPAVKCKVGETPALPKTITATYSDKTTAEVAVTWDAVDTTKAGTVTVAGTVEGTELKASVTVTVEILPFGIDSVTALNAKQLQVVFNKELNSDTVKAGYFKVYDNGSSTATTVTPAVQDDKKTVILTMGDPTVAGNLYSTKLTNASKAKLVVTVDVKTAAGDPLPAEYTKSDISVQDTTMPSVSKIEAAGQKNLKIYFNEPVYDGANDNTINTNQITVKSGVYTYVVSSITSDFAGHFLKVNVGTNLIPGDIIVTLNAQGMSDGNAIRDFAGLSVLKGDTTFTYAKDTAIATAKIDSVDKAAKKVTVKFSKMVYGKNVKMYHSINGAAAYGLSVVSGMQITEANATDTWDFIFANEIPTGSLTFYLVNDSNDSNNQISDLYGVKVPDQTFTYTVVADTTPPTVSEVKVNTNKSFDVVFSEDVKSDEIKIDNFEIAKSNGDKIGFSATAGADAKTVKLLANSDLEDNASYTVTVKSMKDTAGNALAASYSTVAKVGDNKNPTAKAYLADNKTIYVEYSEAMNSDDISNKLNYLIDTVGGANAYKALGDNDKVEKISDKKVKITLDTKTMTSGVSDMQVGAVRDVAGKKLTSDDQFVTAITDVASDKLELYATELIAKNKMKITFNKEIGSFDNTEFLIRETGVAAADPVPATTLDKDYAIQAIDSMTVNSDGRSEVVVIIDNDLRADAKDNSGTPKAIELVTKAAAKIANTKTVEGTVMSEDSMNIADKVAPSIDKIIYVNPTTIQVNFDEDLNPGSIASVGKNGFSVSGGTLTKAVKGAADNVIILTGDTDKNDFSINTDVTYTPGNLTDDTANANAVVAVTKADALTLGELTVKPASPADNTFTVSANFETAAWAAGDVDMDKSTVAMDNTLVVNGVTYTVTCAAGVFTVDATGNSTAVATATTKTIAVIKNGVTKNVTMSIPAAAVAGAAGADPTFN